MFTVEIDKQRAEFQIFDEDGMILARDFPYYSTGSKDNLSHPDNQEMLSRIERLVQAANGGITCGW